MLDSNNTYHSIALTGIRIKEVSHITCLDEGELFSFGNNRCGQLGLGDTVNRNIPVQVTAIRNKKITSIKCGGNANSGFVFAFTSKIIIAIF